MLQYEMLQGLGFWFAVFIIWFVVVVVGLFCLVGFLFVGFFFPRVPKCCAPHGFGSFSLHLKIHFYLLDSSSSVLTGNSSKCYFNEAPLQVQRFNLVRGNLVARQLDSTIGFSPEGITPLLLSQPSRFH